MFLSIYNYINIYIYIVHSRLLHRRFYERVKRGRNQPEGRPFPRELGDGRKCENSYASHRLGGCRRGGVCRATVPDDQPLAFDRSRHRRVHHDRRSLLLRRCSREPRPGSLSRFHARVPHRVPSPDRAADSGWPQRAGLPLRLHCTNALDQRSDGAGARLASRQARGTRCGPTPAGLVLSLLLFPLPNDRLQDRPRPGSPGLPRRGGVLRELARPRETWLRGSIAFVCTSVLGVALWYLLGGPGLMTSILYHAERGLEIESLYAGPLMILGRLTGEPMVAELGHGSYELQCAIAPAAVAASRYVQLLALVFTLVPFVRSRRRSGVQCAGALILGLILTAPVFSPQFIIWVLPFILVMSGSLGRRARPLYALICALTFLIYPVFLHRGLIPLWMSAVLLLNLRNSLLIVLWLLMVFGTESVPQPADLIVNYGDSAGSAHADEEGKGDITDQSSGGSAEPSSGPRSFVAGKWE